MTSPNQRPRRWSRRDALRAALAAPALLLGRTAQAAAIPDFDLNKVLGLGHPIVGGVDPATERERAIADRILKHAPRGRTPLEVMHYFESVRLRNIDGESFNAGWRDRANPVILAFFDGLPVSTHELGDRTSWCAASLNWTLARSGFQGGTHSPLSGSFREAPGVTRHPRAGDIVVFRDTDPNLSAQGFGHVCLFLRQTHDHVYVLGGNQTNWKGHAAFCAKWLAKAGPNLTLHSFHAVDAFR